MSGFHHGQQQFAYDQQGRVLAEYEATWGQMMSGEPQEAGYGMEGPGPVEEVMEDNRHGMEAQHGMEVISSNRHMDQPPPGLMPSSRTDSINSTTVFVNPNEIQPQYNGDQDLGSAEQMASHNQHMQRKTPVKRRHQEIEDHPGYESVLPHPEHGTLQVFNLNVDVAPEDHQIVYTTEAGDQVTIVDQAHLKQERLSQVEPPSPNQDSRLSWTQEPVMINQVGGAQSPSPTGLDPSITQWGGQFMFDVAFSQLSLNTKNKNWDYSKRLKKLFIDMNRFVQAEFRVGAQLPEGMYIRAMPVYAVSSHVRSPVIRCPNHASPNDPTNQNFQYPQHLIRVQDDNAIYDKDVDSERLSVVFPVGAPDQGSDKCFRMLKFMCLGSDVGGINRKPVKVIFSLEAGPGVVMGRKVVDVRICSCPKRDMQQEEDKLDRQEDQAKSVARRLAENISSTHIIMGPPPKKKKVKKGEEIIMVPVAAEDFQKMNEMAEAMMCQRQPEKAQQIKEMRRQKLTEHNQELIHALEKRKKP